MTVRFASRQSIRIAIAVCSTFVSGQLTQAQDEPLLEDNRVREAQPAHFVVLRLSGEMLKSMVDKAIDVHTPVRDVVLGTPVTGVARVTGRPNVVLNPSSDQASFAVVVSGTVYSRTVGKAAAATVHGRAITRFTASTRVVFEPGKGFQALPADIRTRTEVHTDRIDASRGGLIGRIVQRRAWGQVSAKKAQLTAIARQRATTRITAAFERHMDERLARLNRAAEFRTMLVSLRKQEASTPQVVCCTTPHYVEIADAAEGDRSPIALPVFAAASAVSAPIEIWIHNHLVPEGVASALKAVFATPDQNAVVNALAVLPGPLGKDAAAAITALAGDSKIGIQTVGDWTVVELNTQPTAALSIARSISR